MSRISEALSKKEIGVKVLAQVLGVSEKTAWNKVNGRSEFTFSEAMKTKKSLLPEYDLEYLFSVGSDE